jgi:integrase
MAIQVQLVKRYLRTRKRNGQREHRWTVRWEDSESGERRCESTGTADRTAAEALQKAKWAELNIPGAAPEQEPIDAKPPPTWQECSDALQRALEADNLRPSYVSDCSLTLEGFRRMFPEALSPADVTPEMANEYKRRRSETKPAPSPWSVRGDLSTLKAVFGKWLGKECGLLDSNPFADVKAPRCDEPDVRIVSAEEANLLFAWLGQRWNNWWLPTIYLEVAALVGWRATEIASLREEDIMADGFVRVAAESSKTRRYKFGWLPAELHDELKACCANGWAFGRFPDELRRLLLLWKRQPNHAAKVRDFAPKRLVGWLQDELQRFCEARQAAEDKAAADEGREAEKLSAFTLHDFRRTAITGMQMAGVSEKEASIQVGCSPEVMRRHYERLDGMAIARRNGQRRLGISGPESTQLHSARRAGAARVENAPIDCASSRKQTASA